MDESETTLRITGPVTADDQRRILWELRPALWRELHSLLVDEDEELRYGSTVAGGDTTVVDVWVHARVMDPAVALEVVQRLYAASGLPYRATLMVFGAGSAVVAEHPVGGG